MKLNQTDFDNLASKVKKISGITLQEDYYSYIEKNLSSVASKYKINNFRDLILRITSNNQEFNQDIINSVTINETFFFRDNSFFQELTNNIVPFLLDASNKKIVNIWSAACSSGQEPISICIMLEKLKEQGKLEDYNIFASDISTKALNIARRGEYSQFEVQRGLPAIDLIKFFDKKGNNWKFKDQFLQKINFQKHDLCLPFSHQKKFDLIVCLYVLIYFDLITRKKIIDTLARDFNKPGILALGNSEGFEYKCHKFSKFKDNYNIFKYIGD